MVQNVPYRNFYIKLHFLGSILFQIRQTFQKLFIDKLTSCHLKVVFTSPVRVNSFFTFKEKLPKMLLSGLFYKYIPGGCNATYYGKTKHHLTVRICEYLGCSHLTEKRWTLTETSFGWSKTISYVATTLHSLKAFLLWPGKVMILNWRKCRAYWLHRSTCS